MKFGHFSYAKQDQPCLAQQPNSQSIQALNCLGARFDAKDRSKLCNMAVVVEMHNTGNPEARSEVVAMIEHALSDRSGDWRVSIIGSQANDRWEMELTGPNAFERSYTLEGTAGEHEAAVIGRIVSRMVSASKG